MLKADNLSKRYGRRTVLNRVTVSIAPSEFVAIMGPSGSGKTTLLNLLSGLDKPTSGRVNAPGRKQRAFVFQDYNLLEALTAQRNAKKTELGIIQRELEQVRMLHKKSLTPVSRVYAMEREETRLGGEHG